MDDVIGLLMGVIQNVIGLLLGIVISLLMDVVHSVFPRFSCYWFVSKVC